MKAKLKIENGKLKKDACPSPFFNFQFSIFNFFHEAFA
jgi:hypothetical protein